MKRTQRGAKSPQITDLFVSIVRADLKVECVREFRFHPVRRWRFDYAIPQYKIAIEIDGGVWTYGRHNRSSGYIADMEKFNAAASLGWVVLKFTPDDKYKSKTIDIIKSTIAVRKAEKNGSCGNAKPVE